jgi:hypothetical protein
VVAVLESTYGVGGHYFRAAQRRCEIGNSGSYSTILLGVHDVHPCIASYRLMFFNWIVVCRAYRKDDALFDLKTKSVVVWVLADTTITSSHRC